MIKKEEKEEEKKHNRPLSPHYPHYPSYPITHTPSSLPSPPHHRSNILIISQRTLDLLLRDQKPDSPAAAPLLLQPDHSSLNQALHRTLNPIHPRAAA